MVAGAPGSVTTTAGSRRAALGTGASAHAIQDGMTAAVYILLPILSQTFGLSYAQVGLLKGLKNLVQGGLEVFSGILSERIGSGKVLVIGLLLSGFGYAALSLAAGTAMVMVGLVVIGVGTALQHSPASALVSMAYADHGRRSALGLYNSAGDIGKLGFSAGISLAIGAGFAWQKVSFVTGLCALVAAGAIVMVLGLVERCIQGKTGHSYQAEAAEDIGWGILHKRPFVTLLIIVFLDNVAQAGILVFIAFLMLEKGVPIAYATLATVAVLTGGVFGKAGCGYLAEEIGVRPAFIWVQILTAALLICVLWVPGWLAYVLLVPLGVVAQGSTTITYGLVVDMVHPQRIARGYAVMYGSTSFAAGFGPWVFGMIGDNVGLTYSLLAIAGVSLLAVPFMLLLRPVTDY